MSDKKRKRKDPSAKEKKKKVPAFLLRISAWPENFCRPRKALFNLLAIFVSAIIITVFAEWISRADTAVSHWTPALILDSFWLCLKWAAENYVAVLSAIITLTLAGFVLYGLTCSAGTSMLILGILYDVLTSVNYYKQLMRNEPLLPWDFTLIGAAADFASSVGITLTPQVIISFSVTVLVSIVLFLFNKGWGKNGSRLIPRLRLGLVSRLASGAICFALLFAFAEAFYINAGIRNSLGMAVNSWNQTKDYHNNGVLPMLIINMRYVFVEKPSGYSEAAIDELKAEIEENSRETPDTVEEEKTPNIIFVMLEAYGDAEQLKNFTYSEPITPVSDWLEENAVSGYAMTSIFGGGTSITEFMVLTGMSTAFLPPACTPYQQFVNDPVDSYPSFLKTLGYSTLAVHPYGSTYWNRNVAYPNMGIDTFYSLDNCFSGAPRCRYCRYVTDEAVMNEVISAYEKEKAKSDAPVFIHSVTIANHQGYHIEDYTDEERVSITSTEPLSEELQIAFESYVTGLRDTDASLQILIDYFENTDEPTILLIFGDHWGKTGSVDDAFVPAGLFDEGTLYSSHENVRRAYSVPFYIWDNYKGLTGKVDNLSVYQLVPLLTNLYGLERSTYFEYLSQQMEIFRGHYSNTVLLADGTASGSTAQSIKDAKAKMQMLQYDILCGKNYLYSK